MASIYSMLEDLADARENRAGIAADLDSQIRDLEEIRAARCFEVDQLIDALEKNIKGSTLALGQSEKGSRLHAIYVKGHETWDSKRLGGYAVAHPEINSFKKVGNPSVSIRATR